jgi:hypothetical protein
MHVHWNETGHLLQGDVESNPLFWKNEMTRVMYQQVQAHEFVSQEGEIRIKYHGENEGFESSREVLGLIKESVKAFLQYLTIGIFCS